MADGACKGIARGWGGCMQEEALGQMSNGQRILLPLSFQFTRWHLVAALYSRGYSYSAAGTTE